MLQQTDSIRETLKRERRKDEKINNK